MSTTSRTTTRPPPSPLSKRVGERFVLGSDGTRLYVRSREGEAPYLIFCDGIVCSGFIYKYLWSDVPAHLGVAHFHYRAHGRSENPVDRGRIGVEDHARDLDCVRRALGDPPVVLVGHSFGTQVILEAHRQRPLGIAGLVSLCGSYGRVTHTFKGGDTLATSLPHLLTAVKNHPKVARGIWSRVPPRLAVRVAVMLGEVDGQSMNPADLVPYFEHIADLDLGLALEMIERAGEHTAEPHLPEIDVPMLVVAGSRDSFIPPEFSRTLAERVPGARLVMLEGGTHTAPLEHRDRLREELEIFLADIERRQ